MFHGRSPLRHPLPVALGGSVCLGDVFCPSPILPPWWVTLRACLARGGGCQLALWHPEGGVLIYLAVATVVTRGNVSPNLTSQPGYRGNPERQKNTRAHIFVYRIMRLFCPRLMRVLLPVPRCKRHSFANMTPISWSSLGDEHGSGISLGSRLLNAAVAPVACCAPPARFILVFGRDPAQVDSSVETSISTS